MKQPSTKHLIHQQIIQSIDELPDPLIITRFDCVLFVHEPRNLIDVVSENNVFFTVLPYRIQLRINSDFEIPSCLHFCSKISASCSERKK